MHRENFLKLPLHSQVQKLYQDGVFIVAIRYYGYKINLYLLDGTYFEVFYNHKEDRIEKIDELDHQGSRFKFYVDQIKLPHDLVPPGTT